MRVIIIEDKDVKTLVDRLELEKFDHISREANSESPRVREMHRWFHYVVTTWLHEQGASTLK